MTTSWNTSQSMVAFVLRTQLPYILIGQKWPLLSVILRTNEMLYCTVEIVDFYVDNLEKDLGIMNVVPF